MIAIDAASLRSLFLDFSFPLLREEGDRIITLPRLERLSCWRLSHPDSLASVPRPSSLSCFDLRSGSLRCCDPLTLTSIKTALPGFLPDCNQSRCQALSPSCLVSSDLLPHKLHLADAALRLLVRPPLEAAAGLFPHWEAVYRSGRRPHLPS